MKKQMACLVSRALVLRPVQADTLRFVYCTHKPFMATTWLSSINTTRGSRGYSSFETRTAAAISASNSKLRIRQGRAPWAFPFRLGAHTMIMKPSHLHCIRIALLRGMRTSWLLCFCSYGPSHCLDKRATQGLAHRSCWVAIASAITVSVYVSLMLKATNHSPPSWPLTNTYLDGPLSDGDMESSILHYTAARANSVASPISSITRPISLRWSVNMKVQTYVLPMLLFTYGVSAGVFLPLMFPVAAIIGVIGASIAGVTVGIGVFVAAAVGLEAPCSSLRESRRQYRLH